MTRDQTEAEYTAFMMLVATGAECKHPEAFRHRPDWLTDDPKEWRCGVCDTHQIRDARLAREEKES